MKSTILFCAGLAVGALATGIVIGRTSIQMSTMGGVPIIVKYDRWTGKTAWDVALDDQSKIRLAEALRK